MGDFQVILADSSMIFSDSWMILTDSQAILKQFSNDSWSWAIFMILKILVIWNAGVLGVSAPSPYGKGNPGYSCCSKC